MIHKIDFLCLGQTVPEKSKKYGFRVCTAGIDLKSNSLVRIYPLAVDRHKHFKRWNVYQGLKVKRNNKDNRKESWKLGFEIDKLKDVPSTVYKLNNRSSLIQYFKTEETIQDLNNRRASLAIIDLQNPKGYFADRKKNPVNTNQLILFGQEEKLSCLTKDDFEHTPRVKFRSVKNTKHDLMLTSWSVFMHQKNLAPKYGKDNLWKCLKMNKNIKTALIGNINTHRNSWLIISMLS